MPRFSANVSHLFTEVPFLERFAAATACGFKGAECLFPYAEPADRVGDAVATAGLSMTLFNAPPGDYAAGERGLAALPGRQQEFRDSIEVALNFADLLECKRIHVLAGIVPEDKWDEALDVYIANLAVATDLAREIEIDILIEPIVMDGYFLFRPDDALQVLEDVGAKNLKILYDIFHAQRGQGGITDFLDNHLDKIGHIQIAGVPGRHEPDRTGELNWPYLFDLLDAHGYAGWVGTEYNPRVGTHAGLGWAKDWGISAP
ncbi:MAG: TIM barrel protein [Alphaproteobacteria bacterium]|nr:TIM barrel protein [Alphaproteobacteria bacterium]